MRSPSPPTACDVPSFPKLLELAREAATIAGENLADIEALPAIGLEKAELIGRRTREAVASLLWARGALLVHRGRPRLVVRETVIIDPDLTSTVIVSPDHGPKAQA